LVKKKAKNKNTEGFHVVLKVKIIYFLPKLLL